MDFGSIPVKFNNTFKVRKSAEISLDYVALLNIAEAFGRAYSDITEGWHRPQLWCAAPDPA